MRALMIPACAIISAWSSVVFAADRISFQGLDGSSNKADVLKIFPQAKAGSLCRPGQTTQKFADGEHSCVTLTIENYDIENRAYDVSFGFWPDGMLAYALVMRPFGKLIESLSKADLRQQYESLYKALNYKYGDPLEEPRTLREMPTDCFSGNGDYGWHCSKCAEWQSGPSQKFEAGQNHITLKLNAYASPDDQQIKPDDFTGYNGDIAITYKFVNARTADRL